MPHPELPWIFSGFKYVDSNYKPTKSTEPRKHFKFDAAYYPHEIPVFG